MVRLVDVPLDAGDPNRVVTQIEEAIVESRSQERAAPRQESSQTTTRSAEGIADPRFAGKSAAEIYESYRNLEAHSGRLANQLGEAKNQVNTLILGKRENDLQKGNGRERSNVQAADFLVNPTEALDRYLESRDNPEVSALQNRLAQLEAQLSQTMFTVNNPKASEVTQDPAFAAWVRQTPLRATLADAAAKGDLVQADLLLKEWQHTKGTQENSPTREHNRAQDLARSVSLESTTTGSESGDGRSTRGTKKFSRRDLQALRIRDPDKYESEALQKEIVKAYLEGRVTD
jgi:hypothetical protein